MKKMLKHLQRDWKIASALAALITKIQETIPAGKCSYKAACGGKDEENE